MLFQLVRLELNENGKVISRSVTQPLYGLREDAMAMAEFEAARCFGEYDYDAENDCWNAIDAHHRMFRFAIEPITVEAGIAA
jgi:hypothetical protein